MELDLQRAGGWKRISAAMLDMILPAVLAAGIATGLSALFGYDSHADGSTIGESKTYTSGNLCV